MYVLGGASLFLLIFFCSYFFADYTGIYGINFVGPVGMLLFIAALSYVIVRFNIFNIKMIAAQALMIFLWALIGSLLFIIQSMTGRLVAGFTLVAAVILGFMLIRSIQRTLKQKEEIEKLAKKLEAANEQLKVLDKMKSEFVSIASHQLRSPLTSIRGYASMLLEGSFGAITPKAKEAVERIAESSRFMASSVEDYLNVSRIQAGNMKYEYSDFNLKDLAERVADDTRQIALKKGLLVTFKSDVEKRGIVHADVGKTRQVIDNLINNALKYTPKGSIDIFVHDNPKLKKIYVEVSDTGIGMKPHTIESLFEKFERAENANVVNVTGTGLGLYIARKMAQEMKGDVTAASEGENKGSTFTLTLPLQM
jgi:signal transduction histidine kinase